VTIVLRHFTDVSPHNSVHSATSFWHCLKTVYYVNLPW